MSKGSSLLMEIDVLVTKLDPDRRSREPKRRRPWLAYEAVDRKVKDIDLRATISKFISLGCQYLKAKRDAGEFQLPGRNEMKRLNELVRAVREDRLLQAVHIKDPDLLSRFCCSPLAKLYKEGVLRQSDQGWRVWAFAMFHDVWGRHRSQKADFATFMDLLFFVERIEHKPLVDQLRNAFPGVARSLQAIQKDRRSQSNRERKQR